MARRTVRGVPLESAARSCGCLFGLLGGCVESLKLPRIGGPLTLPGGRVVTFLDKRKVLDPVAALVRYTVITVHGQREPNGPLITWSITCMRNAPPKRGSRGGPAVTAPRREYL